MSVFTAHTMVQKDGKSSKLMRTGCSVPVSFAAGVVSEDRGKGYSLSVPTAAHLSESGFDNIVSTLYDASAGGCEWSTALRPIQEVFGARCAVLHTLDLSDARMLSLHVGGPNLEHPVYDYVTAWERHDPRKQRSLKLGPEAVGRWLHCDDAFDANFREGNIFFREYADGHAMGYNSNVSFALDERTATGFILELHASRGPLDKDERELARRFGQHVKQALINYERMRKLAAQTLVGHQLVQAFAYPMWLLDQNRAVQFANEAALVVEATERPLLRQQGRLRLTDFHDDRRLSVQMHTLLQAPHNARHALRLGRKGELPEHTAWLHLSVLEPQLVMGQAFGPLRYVLATLFRPSQLSALDPFALAQMFDMTPAVARVAALLGEGLEPEAIARRLNVRPSTVRTHVRQVMSAMGQHRITDVVRVLRQGEALWAARGDETL
jgi:DNA-binding NarL/FixJ family response regulator